MEKQSNKKDELFKKYQESKAKRDAKKKELERLRKEFQEKLFQPGDEQRAKDKRRDNIGAIEERIRQAIQENPEAKKLEADRMLDELTYAKELYKRLYGEDEEEPAKPPKAKRSKEPTNPKRNGKPTGK